MESFVSSPPSPSLQAHQHPRRRHTPNASHFWEAAPSTLVECSSDACCRQRPLHSGNIVIDTRTFQKTAVSVCIFQETQKNACASPFTSVSDGRRELYTNFSATPSSNHSMLLLLHPLQQDAIDALGRIPAPSIVGCDHDVGLRLHDASGGLHGHLQCSPSQKPSPPSSSLHSKTSAIRPLVPNRRIQRLSRLRKMEHNFGDRQLNVGACAKTRECAEPLGELTPKPSASPYPRPTLLRH